MQYIRALMLFIITPFVLCAQVGGKQGYNFVNFPLNANQAALGGINVTAKDADPNLIHANPGLLHTDMAGKGSVSYVPFFADIWGTQVTGVFEAGPSKRLFGVAMQYFNYGSAPRTDVTGATSGTVSANDFYLQASHGRTLGNFTMGVNAKLIGSQIDVHSSYAILADMGGTWKHPKRDLVIGLLVKNVGAPIKNYESGAWVAIPLDVQAGISYKLEHLPFRFSATLHHLYRWDVTYNDPAFNSQLDVRSNNVANRQGYTWYDNVFRHIVFGGTFFLTKGFHIRGGYNHMLRSEMRLPNELGASGFSAGFMLRIKAVELAYTSMFLHSLGNTNLFTLTIRFSKMQSNLTKKEKTSDPAITPAETAPGATP